MHSCLYSGRLSHRRHWPVAHGFTHRLFMVYLDLAELPQVFSKYWLWSATRPAPAWFRRGDHLGDPRQPLDACVRDLVQQHLGWRPRGPIRLLTHLRYFGHSFNPVSFYYCFDAADTQIEAMVLEVNNTPWGERYCYVLHNDGAAGIDRYRFAKSFHVSPFLPMDLDYQWRFRAPAETLALGMHACRRNARVFDASVTLRRREITATNLAATLVRQPLMTVKVVALIYYQALRLWLKRVPVYTHPGRDHHR